MRILAITVLLICLACPSAQAGEWFTWDEANTKLHAPLTVLMVVDLGQTLWIAENHETQMMSMAKSYLVYNKVDDLKEIGRKIEIISAAEIQDIALEVLDERALSSLIYQ